jgi:hypothetical protein
MNPKEFFKNQLNKDKNYKNTTLDELFTKAKKEKGLNMPHFQYESAGYEQQADLLTLPNDAGYSLCLVVVDQGNRKVDCEPLKNKESLTVSKALKNIYKRKILKKPKSITVDQGTEFQGNFKNTLKDMGIDLRVIKAGRHRSVALVERKNQTIGTLIHKLSVQNKLAGYDTSKWVEYLPDLVEVINDKTEKQLKKMKKKPDEPIAVQKGTILKLFNVNDKVRIALDNPETINGKKLVGKFRSADLRFSPQEYKITSINVMPNQPILYGTDADTHLRTYQQLLKVGEPELYFKEPEKPVGKVDNDRFEFEKILERKVENNKIYYLVKWKNYPKKNATWELKTELIKDVPQAVKLFEAKLKK